METATRDSALGRRRWPGSRPRRSASAKALAAALHFHAPLTGRGEDNSHRSRPGQGLERPELDDDGAPELI